MPLTRFLDDAAQDFPDLAGLQFRRHAVSYRQLLDHVDRFATVLRELGVTAGDRIGVVLPSWPQHVVTVFAVLRLGAVVVEHDPELGDDELAARLGGGRWAAVVVADRRLPTILAIPERPPVVVASEHEYLPFPRNVLLPLRRRRRRAGAERFKDRVRRSAPEARQAVVGRDDLAMLLANGGGSLVELSHGNLAAAAFQARLWIPDVLAGQERLLLAAPLSGLAGALVGLGAGTLSAATLILPASTEPDGLAAAVARTAPTLLVGTSASVAALATGALDRRRLASLRVVLAVGPPLPAAAVAALESATGGKVRSWYGPPGMPPTHANPVYGRARQESAGLPLPDTVCCLVDPQHPGCVAPQGARGLLAVAGPQLPGPGWHVTREHASIDEEGYLHLLP